jgi:hypothetical protein
MCPVSGHARAAPTLRVGAWSFPYRYLSRLHLPQSAVTPHSGRANGWVVFPRTGEGRGEPGWPPAALPLTGEKQKGAAWVMAGLASAISARFPIGLLRGVQMYPTPQKRYYSPPDFSLRFPKCRRSLSGVSHGHWGFPCLNPWIRWSASCLPSSLRVLSVFHAKTTQNVNLAPLAGSPPQFRWFPLSSRIRPL